MLYVLEGEMWYWERPIDGAYSSAATIIRRGECRYTPPLVVHQTYFPKFTTLISCSARRRDRANHESDVVRVEEPWQTLQK